ncbi:MAG: histidine phosphatase family protein [Actinomycetota bacterium]|nr:histidine phosphatase family protein [Actinomycetota bacterium]
MSVRVHLVRHGRAAAGWGEDRDPGLDEVGRAQAAELATQVSGIGPMAVLSSPFQRAQQTAAPLAERWGVEPVLEPMVGEIPSPTEDLAERSAWLRDALRSRWADLGATVIEWRARLLATLLGLPTDTVVFTHFVAINAVVGAAGDDAALIVFAPANASHTVIDIRAGELSLVQLGRQADSAVT